MTISAIGNGSPAGPGAGNGNNQAQITAIASFTILSQTCIAVHGKAYAKFFALLDVAYGAISILIFFVALIRLAVNYGRHGTACLGWVFLFHSVANHSSAKVELAKVDEKEKTEAAETKCSSEFPDEAQWQNIVAKFLAKHGRIVVDCGTGNGTNGCLAASLLQCAEGTNHATADQCDSFRERLKSEAIAIFKLAVNGLDASHSKAKTLMLALIDQIAGGNFTVPLTPDIRAGIADAKALAHESYGYFTDNHIRLASEFNFHFGVATAIRRHLGLDGSKPSQDENDDDIARGTAYADEAIGKLSREELLALCGFHDDQQDKSDVKSLSGDIGTAMQKLNHLMGSPASKTDALELLFTLCDAAVISLYGNDAMRRLCTHSNVEGSGLAANSPGLIRPLMQTILVSSKRGEMFNVCDVAIASSMLGIDILLVNMEDKTFALTGSDLRRKFFTEDMSLPKGTLIVQHVHLHYRAIVAKK
ncbi:MAG: hypothetical protein LBI39_00420 [Puniceicoccales bacterium]|jgi:hypothetical protein|nr:hypothetical protein [Puniceicoccales bacterium]